MLRGSLCDEDVLGPVGNGDLKEVLLYLLHVLTLIKQKLLHEQNLLSQQIDLTDQVLLGSLHIPQRFVQFALDLKARDTSLM